MNKEEKKAQKAINSLKVAVFDNDRPAIDKANRIIATMDATKVRQSLLDDLDELFEHDNYGTGV